MKQKVAILGATGSIGSSTLALLSEHSERYEVYAISGYHRLDELLLLCQKFQPKRVVVKDGMVDAFAAKIKQSNLTVEVLSGQKGLVEVAQDSQVDIVVAAIVGAAGLLSTMAAVKAGKRVLLANKESLVMAGSLLMTEAKRSKACLLPVDSEHNAIFQCLPKSVQLDNEAIHDKDYGVKSLWLTASGGPFLYQSFLQMQNATVEQAVSHPNWSMGQKISVDSATMMNKGLELIEACHLFSLPEDKVNVVIHPQSIIHSLVEYVDGSFLAQMGSPDMKTPIAHALAYPNRIDSGVQSLDLCQLSQLAFLSPDLQKFACLQLAREAMRSGSFATIVLNAANEISVAAFLAKKIRLTDIATFNEQTMMLMLDDSTQNKGRFKEVLAKCAMIKAPKTLEEIDLIDEAARQIAQVLISSIN